MPKLCYRLNSATGMDYLGRLSHSVELALQINENIVITGDLNSYLLCKDNNKLIDMLTVFNFSNVIEKPTRFNPNGNDTLLDPIIISDTLRCVYSDVYDLPDSISDHKAAVAHIECQISTTRTFQREIWQYDDTDILKI